MVTSVTSFGRSRLSDWVLQRVSAVVPAVYAVWVLGFFVTTAPLDHAALAAFFGSLPVKLFTTLAVLALAAHGWINMWTIGTDYVRQHYFGRMHTVLLAGYQMVCLAAIFVYVLWPLSVVWRL